MSDLMTGDPSAAPPTPEQLAANPDLMKRHTDFGEETATNDLEDRDFQFGERVVIDKDAIVQDKERRNEGMTDIEINPTTGERNPNYVPLKDRQALEVNTKGMKGTLLNGSYWSEERKCYMAPVELGPDSIVYVDERKLERAEKSSKFAIAPHMTDEDRKMAVDMKTYMAAQSAAFLERLPFPTFTDWLALRKPKEN